LKNAMQLKAAIRSMSKSRNISAQIVLQNYMLERLLERISISQYRSNFILKGGFLIAAMVGLETRATMDMDATIRGLAVEEDTMKHVFEEICGILINDDISFSLKRVEEIREGDEYSGLRVMLEATYQPMVVPLRIDITTGDQITPREIDYEVRMLFEEGSIRILAYNVETVMAEKLETVISRGDQNTRSRDYYDIYILRKLQWHNVKPDSLRLALVATATKRNSLSIMERYGDILQTVSRSEAMNKRWLDYQRSFDYARGIPFSDVCATITEILDCLDI
jgi:predicted nucleotidyltransferase component of viral defense system